MLANSGHVITLANSNIGVGLLAMPFCFQKCGIVLSIILLITSNWVTRICCHYLIKSSLLTRRKSLEFLGFHAFGPSGKMLVELCIIGFLLGTCVTYFVVVGDLGPQIISNIFALQDGYAHLRVLVMSVVTLFCILPLGMLKNVDSLVAVSTASIGFYFCLIIKIVLESKNHVLANDWSEKVNYWTPSGVLQCLPIFSMSLACQMQIFEVFSNINNASIDRLNNIVKNASWICTLVYIGFGFFGYVAFCNQKFSGNILLNFTPSLGSDVIKTGFVLSVAFSFPIIIFPCRASIYSFLYRKGHVDATSYMPESRFKVITIFIVFSSLCFAIVLPSVELVIGLVGSTIGVAICIIFPALCFRRINKKDSTEKSLAQLITVVGFCLMILSTYANLSAIDENRSGAHLEKEIIENNIFKPDAKPTHISVNNVEPNDKLKESVLKNLENSKNIAKEVQVVAPLVETSKPHADQAKVTTAIEIVIPEPEKVKLPALTEEQYKVNTNSSLKVERTKSDQQSIDTDAIKKDEDVAAEESRNNNKQTNENAVDLQKTQHELKQAKKLIKELAKKNEETQNVVAEKLDKIAEKVDQIERQVQQTKEKQQNAEEALAPKAISPKASDDKQKIELPKQTNKVFEPLSYLTGELVESTKNNTKVDGRLPLPLALLINAAQAKNKTVAEQTQPADMVKDVKKTDETAKNNDIKLARRNILQTNDTDNKAGNETHRTKRSDEIAAHSACTNCSATDTKENKTNVVKLETDDL